MKRVIHDLLIGSAERFPRKPAVFFKKETMTYAEIAGAAEKLAYVLKSKGVQKGDRVAFFLEKRFEKVISIFGISMAGGVMVPIRRISTAAQVTHILNNSGTRVLITTYSRLRELEPHFDELESLEVIIAIGNAAAFQPSHQGGPLILDWQQALEKIGPTLAPLPAVVDTDLAAILYTSGSTGKPKGVILNHRNIVVGAYTVSGYVRNTEHDRLLSILPFNFDYGLNQLTSAFLHGAQIVLLDPLFPKDILRAIERYQITGLAAVAATWIQLLQIPWDREKLKSLRYLTNSGGAIPENYVLEILDRLPHASLYLMYGLTEAFRSTYLDPALVRERPTSMGKAIPGEEIMILDENDRPVKPGEVGELVHRGALVAQGYWGDPENTATRFRPNPRQPKEVPIPEMVVYSGDYVRIDEEGYLYFVGRKDEMIKYAGNRVSPTEVEEVIYQLDAVKDVMVLGIPDKVYGQVIRAVVSLRSDSGVDAEAVMAHCKRQLPPYMIPQTIEIWDELPRNANGKLDRAAIRKAVFERLALKRSAVNE